MAASGSVLEPAGGGPLSSLFQCAAIGMTVVDRAGRIVAANPAFQAFLGYPEADLVGRPCAAFSEEAATSDAWAELLRGERAHLVALKRYRRQDGRRVWGRVTLSASAPDDPYLLGMVEDVTDHQRTERRHAIRLAVTQQLAEAPSAQAALDGIFDAMCRTLEWDYGELWLLDGDARRLEHQLSWYRGSPELQAFAEESRQMTFERGVGLPGRVWAEGRPVWLQDARQDPYLLRHAVTHAHGLRGAIAFPIVSGPEFLGVMGFFSRQLEEPDEDLLAMMVDVGAQIDQFLMRRRAEDKLLQLGAVLAATDDAVLTVTPDGRLADWNQAAVSIYGYPAEELAGRPFGLLLPADRAEEGRTLLRLVQGGERIEHLETVHRRKDGSRVDVSVTVAPVLDAQGRVCCLTTVVRDITARKQADRYKDEFLAALSHELKTPLNFITGFASLLAEDEGLTDSQRSGIGHILEGADRLYRMIRNLLCLTDIQADRFRLSPEHTALEGLVQEAVLSQLTQADQKGLSLETSVQQSLEVYVDGHRAIQLLAILVENAIKFTPPGGRIRIVAGLDGGDLRLEVTDTGIGIAPADLPRVFARMQQVDMSSTRRAGGLGLGLPIARAIVEAHGGRLGVESEPGKGSTFWALLPQPKSAWPTCG